VPVAETAKAMGDFAECLALDQHVDGRKALLLLCWQPKHGGFIDGVEDYHMSQKMKMIGHQGPRKTAAQFCRLRPLEGINPRSPAG
jgi:hypothetical protein